MAATWKALTDESESLMPQPQSLDTRFETFLQALPNDYVEQAYAFKAFARARKIKTPQQLLQLVMLYCGLDLSLRSCAGEWAHHQGYISDEEVKKRLSTRPDGLHFVRKKMNNTVVPTTDNIMSVVFC